MKRTTTSPTLYLLCLSTALGYRTVHVPDGSHKHLNSGGRFFEIPASVLATVSTHVTADCNESNGSSGHAPVHYVRTVRHGKVAGNGYKKGSPLYAKQQKIGDQQNATAAGLNATSAGMEALNATHAEDVERLGWLGNVKMNKIPAFWWWMIVLAVLIGVLYLFGEMWVSSSIKTGIEQNDRDYIGADVTFGAITVNLFQGLVKISDVTIENPPGFKSPHFLKVDEILVDLGMIKLITSNFKQIHIDELLIKDGEAVIEYKGLFGGDSNIHDIQTAMTKSGLIVEKGPEVIVHKMKVTGVTARLQAKLFSGHVALSDLDYPDLEKVAGSTQEVFSKILNSIGKTLLESAAPHAHKHKPTSPTSR